MPASRLSLRTTCATCGHPIPMTAAALEVVCPTCDARKALRPSDFIWILAEGSLRTRGVPAPSTPSDTIVLGEASVAPVTCVACGATFDDHAIESAQATGAIACPCGRALAIRPVPGDMDPERWWTAFIGESTVAPVSPATVPVRFSCPDCGAALLVDGTTRTPECRHCATRPYLPDDLWRAVRPTPKVEPFYLWIDPTWYGEWSRQKAAQSRAILRTVVFVVLGMAAGGSALTAFPATAAFLGTDDHGGPAPWYAGALFSVIFSWMVAWAAAVLVAHGRRPRRPDG